MRIKTQCFQSIAWHRFGFSLAFILLLGSSAFTQTILHSPQVWSVAGDHYTENDLELSWTIGEVAIATLEQGENILTQGFHQSEDMYLNVVNQKQLQLVITPNGDGLNDVFVLEDILNFPNNEIIILNRWGSTVFQAQPYLNDWQGTYNGKPLPEGTYYYAVRLDLLQGEILYGSITINR